MTREELVQEFYGNEGKIGGGGFGDLVAAKAKSSNPLVEVGKAIGDDLMLSLKSIPHLPAALLPSNGTMGWLDPTIPDEERQMRRRAVANAAMLLSGAGFAALGSKLVAGTAPTVVRALLHPGTVGAVENVIFGEIDRDPAERGNRGIEMAGDAALGAGFGLAGRAIGKMLGARTVKKAAEEAAQDGGRAARRQAEDVLARMAVARANPSRLLGGIGSADADQILADSTPEVQAAVKSLLGEMDLEERIAALAGPERTPQSMSLLDNTIRIMNERKASADAGDFDWMDDAIRRAAAVSEGEVKSQAALGRGDYVLPSRDGMRKILHTEASYHPTFKDRNERLKFASELLGRNVSTFSDLDSQEALYVVNAMRITRGQSPFVPPSSGVFRPIKAGKGTSTVQFPDQVHAQFYDLADDLKTRIMDTQDLEEIAKVMDIPVDAVPAAAKMYRDWVDATVQSLGDVKMDMLSFHDFMEKIPSLVTLSRTQVLQAITDRQNGLAASRMGLANARSVPAASRAPKASRGAAVGRRRSGKQAQESSDHLGTGTGPGEAPAPTGGGGGPVSWDNPPETRRAGSAPARRPRRTPNIRWKDAQGDPESGVMFDEQLTATRKMLAQETAAMQRLANKATRSEADEVTLSAIRDRVKVLTGELAERERFLQRGGADDAVREVLASGGLDEKDVDALMAARNVVRTTGNNNAAEEAATKIVMRDWEAKHGGVDMVDPKDMPLPPSEVLRELDDQIKIKREGIIESVKGTEFEAKHLKELDELLAKRHAEEQKLRAAFIGPQPVRRRPKPEDISPRIGELVNLAIDDLRKQQPNLGPPLRVKTGVKAAAVRNMRQISRRPLTWKPTAEKPAGAGLSVPRGVKLEVAIGRTKEGKILTRNVAVTTAREGNRGIYRITGWTADDRALLPSDITVTENPSRRMLRKLEAGRDAMRTILADLYNHQGAVAVRIPTKGEAGGQLKLLFEQLEREGRVVGTKNGLYSLKSSAGIGPQRVTKESLLKQRAGSPAAERLGQQRETSASVMLRRLGYDPRNMASSKIEGVWRSEAGDQPVKVIGSYGVKDGIEYLQIEGSNTGIPANQFLSGSNMKLNTELQKLDEEARRAYEAYRSTGVGKEYKAALADIERRRAEILDKDPVGKTIAKLEKNVRKLEHEREVRSRAAGADPKKVAAQYEARIKKEKEKIFDLRGKGAASEFVELPKFEEPSAPAAVAPAKGKGKKGKAVKATEADVFESEMLDAEDVPEGVETIQLGGDDEMPNVPKERVVDPDAVRPSAGVVAAADAPTAPAKKGKRKKPVASPKTVDERTALLAIQAEIRAVKGKPRKTEQLYNNEEFGNRVLNLVEQYKKAGVEVPRSLKAAERRVTLRLENQEKRAAKAAAAEEALAASPEDVKMLAMASNGLLDEVKQAVDAVGGRATALPEDVKAAIRARTEELLGHYKARGIKAPGGLWIAHRQASPKKGT